MESYLIDVRLTDKKKPKPDESNLGFGSHFTDHMFVMDYTVGVGWHDARIVPYEPFLIDPSAMVFHYGQSVFEGLKAYHAKDGRTLLFRPKANFARMNTSNERLCIPQIDEKQALDALIELIKVDRDWIPKSDGTSLYIRPFIIATESSLGVRASHSYKFFIILSPVGSYYKDGINPVKIMVEKDYVRTFRGGVGYAKAAANYLTSLKGFEKAVEQGYAQVLWLDGVHRKYVEEVGTTNIFFVIGDKVVTPMLTDCILPGVTRDSVIQVLKSWGIPIEERKIAIDEIFEAHASSELREAFGTGTAAVVSPIAELKMDDKSIEIGNGKIGEITQKLYDTLTGIQYGEISDEFDWILSI